MSVADAGLRTVEDIHGGLQIDEEWSVRAERGFTWWPYRHAQRVWAEEPVEDDGVTLSLVHVETAAMRGLESRSEGARRTEGALGALMGQASLAGLAIDGDAVRFRSTILVHDQSQPWASPLIQMAAVVQIANAERVVGGLASTLELEPDESHHPERGPRPEPDEMIDALNGLPLRDRPWGEQAEFEEVSAFLNERGVFSMTGELGFAAEFPYGRNGGPAVAGGTSHLLEVESTENGEMGLGLRMTLRLREWPMSGDRQIFPTELNGLEARGSSGAHLLGSWAIAQDQAATPHFTCFLPSVLYKPGLLLNLVLAMGVRTRWASGLIP